MQLKNQFIFKNDYAKESFQIKNEPRTRTLYNESATHH